MLQVPLITSHEIIVRHLVYSQHTHDKTAALPSSDYFRHVQIFFVDTNKNIFRILDGAHIPSGGQTSAQAQLANEVSDAARSTLKYFSVTLKYFQVGEPKEYEYEYYDDTPQESPFVNPHDPNHQNVSDSIHPVLVIEHPVQLVQCNEVL